VKALGRARELDPDDWMCLYLIGEVQCQTGQYKEAIASFESVLVERPSELGVLVSLAYANFYLGREQVVTGFGTRAETSFLTCIKTALRAIDSSPGFRRVAWKVIADSLYHLSDASSFADVVQVRNVLTKVQQLCTTSSSERLAELSLLPLESPQPATGTKILDLSVVAYDYRISLGFHDDKAKASSWFDFGTALQALCKRNGLNEHRQRAQDQSIQCFKEAIIGDPGNELYWMGLGNAYFETNPKNAQHAYVRALEINSKVRPVKYFVRSYLLIRRVERRRLGEFGSSIFASRGP
jgi:superkiller protein 3